MSQKFLLCIYFSILIAEIILLLRAWKSERILTWVGLYILDVGAVVAALSILRHYNEHQGYMMSTLGHVLFSMGAAGVFCIMVLITIIAHILRATVFKYH